jgi:alpha-tubulin suppressor-like RCC1 family protein
VKNVYQLTKAPITDNQKIQSVHCGNDFTVALSRTGTLLSTGSGLHGIHCNKTVPNVFDSDVNRNINQSTFDRNTFESIPLSFFGGTLITAVSVGETHAAAINMNGELWMWGSNSYGQCGVPALGNEEITVPVRPFYENQIDQKISLVAGGGRHSLALASDNTVYSWGNNQFG